MWIKIEPLDVLLFRESKPFDAGENFRAAGRFPPSGLPLVGALRSRAMSHLNIDVRQYADCARNDKHHNGFDKIGIPDSLSPLAVMGPFLMAEEENEEEIYLPWPQDLLLKDDEDAYGKGDVVFLKPKEKEHSRRVQSFSAAKTLQNLAVSQSGAGKMKTGEGGFMKGSSFAEYLTAGLLDYAPPIEYLGKHAVAITETRLGIALNDKRTVEKGRIYAAQFSRLTKGAAFLLQLRDTQAKDGERKLLPPEGFLALGGEARAACFKCLAEDEIACIGMRLDDRNIIEDLVEKLTGKRRFKLYLLTSAIFDKGWLPDDIDDSNFTWQAADGVQAKLIAAAVGKPEDVGGWDLVRNIPRPLYRAAPAGSVYFFEAREDFTEETARKLLDKIHLQSLMQDRTNIKTFRSFCREAGFGLAAVGLWDYKQED